MIPDTVGAFLAFLGLIAPGVLFELRRERRRPNIEETSFREASRVALTSLIYTLASLAALTCLRLVRPNLVADFPLWFKDGGAYVVTHFGLVVRTLVLEVALALVLVLLTDYGLARFRRERGRIVPGGLWFQALNRDVPPNCSVWAHVRLTDGTTFWGFVRGYAAEEKIEDREICLEGVRLSQQDPPRSNQDPAPVVRLGDEWEYVLIHADKVRYLRVYYLDNDTNEQVFSARRKDALVRINKISAPPPAPVVAASPTGPESRLRSGAEAAATQGPGVADARQEDRRYRRLLCPALLAVAILALLRRRTAQPGGRSASGDGC